MSDEEKHFEGHEGRECGEHRTVGAHRAWCYTCNEWCYPSNGCKGCEIPRLEAEIDRLRDLGLKAWQEGWNACVRVVEAGDEVMEQPTTVELEAEIERLRADHDDWRNIAGMAEREVDHLRAEAAAATEVLERARSYAHACGLFTGGDEMESYVAIAEILRAHDNCPDEEEMDACKQHNALLLAENQRLHETWMPISGDEA